MSEVPLRQHLLVFALNERVSTQDPLSLSASDAHTHECYRGTSLIRNSPPLGPYSRPMPRNLWWV